MAISRRTGRSRFTLLVLVLASITLLTLDFRDTGPVQSLRDAGAVVFDPVRDATDKVAEPIGNAWDGIFGYGDLKDENEELRKRIDDLEGQKIDSDAARREVAALKEQLQIKQASNIPTVAAKVVSGPLTSFDSTITINRGSGDGIRKGMSARTGAGLVGRVIQVTGDRSVIQLITDPSSKIGIELAELGDRAIAQGTGSSGRLDVDGGIVVGTQVKRGDAVVTASVDDAAVPPSLPVGRVVSVGQTDDRTERTLVIKPSADLRALTYVAVLLCDEDCT